MFSSKEADKKMGASTTPKVIQPGIVIARVLDISIDVPPYDASAFNVVLNLETQPIGEGFEGLAINKDSPELGNYQGQVARVQTQQYSYSDYTNKDGNTTLKEDMIFKWIWNFAKEIGIADTLKEKDIQGATIEEYINNAKPYLVSKDRWFHFCIGGSEYENKSGYMQYRLFLVKQEGAKKAYQVYVEGQEPTKLIAFNEAQHIKRKKPVDSFAGRDGGSDLDLD